MICYSEGNYFGQYPIRTFAFGAVAYGEIRAPIRDSFHNHKEALTRMFGSIPVDIQWDIIQEKMEQWDD